MNEDRVQLTFDVGGESPTRATLKVGGSMGLDRELRKGEQLGIRIVDADGQLIAQADGHVSAVTFKDKRTDGYVESTERAHTVTVD